MIADKVLQENGSLQKGFQASTQSGVSATTYISHDLVIQKRSLHFYHAWKSRMEILTSIPDPEELLLASRCCFEKDQERGCFWVEYQRRDLAESPSHFLGKEMTPDTSITLFQKTLPLILETEKLLRKTRLSQKETLCLMQGEISKTHGAFITNHQLVRDVFHRLGKEITAPMPKSAGVDLTHGDAILKNIILSDRGYRLIDWERLGIYPREATLSHAISCLLIRIPSSFWHPFLEKNLKDCLELMEMDQDQAILSIYWYMLREILYWSRWDDVFSEHLEKVDHILE